MASRFGNIPPFGYSDPKDFYGTLPVSSQDQSQVSATAAFSCTRLQQTPIMEAITTKPVDKGHIGSHFDVSLAEVIDPVKTCVGFVSLEGEQLGSCTLIAHNLAILTCHSLEGIPDMRAVQVAFGYGDGLVLRGYRILEITECNQDLDYAIVRLSGAPGKDYGVPELSKTPYTEASALLHHPKNKQLQISVHGLDKPGNAFNYLSTYHDSHYGSSGGSYIDPRGKLFAIHLGAERGHAFNLVRLALPLSTIAECVPEGIIAKMLRNKLPQNHVYAEGQAGAPICYLDTRVRSYILDLEKWDSKRAINHGGGEIEYKLEMDSEDLRVIVESYQKKHSRCWPVHWRSGIGNDFKLSLDDTISLLQIVANNCDELVANPPAAQRRPSKIRWEVKAKKSIFKDADCLAIYKHLVKQGFNTLYIYAAYSESRKAWEIHVYPE